MSVPPDDIVPPPPHDPVPPVDPVPPPYAGSPTAEERQWAMFAHLSALIGGLLTGHWLGIGCFLAPLIIWMVKKDTLPFVADQAKEALNFNITVAIAGLICGVLMLVLIGVVLLPVLAIAWLVLVIMAAIKANEGVAYRYPFALRLIK